MDSSDRNTVDDPSNNESAGRLQPVSEKVNKSLVPVSMQWHSQTGHIYRQI